MSELLADIAQWIIDIVYYFGYIGVATLIALGNLHLPIPTQLVLTFAGFLVGQGRFSFVLVLVAATIGAVFASLVLYYLGLWIGEEGLRRFVGRLEGFRIIFRSDLDKASKVFERHGGKAILIGHLVPGVGALISIPAGLKRMPIFGRFMIYTVLGSTLWNVSFIALGWALGAQWTIVEHYTPILEYAVLAAIAGAILWFLWYRWTTYKKYKK
jgi:membrane protein DedA with SNARE-associated domain